MTLIAAEPKKRTNSGNIIAEHPVLVLTIANGAGHITAAQAVVEEWKKSDAAFPAQVVEISQFMSPIARFTHVNAYLWLVKNTPSVWEKIDNYQKRQTSTSPEWFYRRNCRRLFDLAKKSNPVAMVATEVGCAEIGAILKRDLQLNIPLIAVILEYEAERAWVQPEVDFYCVTMPEVGEDLVKLGAAPEKIGSWGMPINAAFSDSFNREKEREKVSKWLDLPKDKPLVVVAGGGEGMGKIKQITEHLLKIDINKSIVVLAGKNQKLKRDCEYLAEYSINLRVLGWTDRIPQLYRSADLLISKLGNAFDEAMACGLPIIALPPPPGAERVQYNLLEKKGIGCAVKTVEEAGQKVKELLNDPGKLAEMRARAKDFSRTDAAAKVVEWLKVKL